MTIREGRLSDLEALIRLEVNLTAFDRAFDSTLSLEWPQSEAGREFYVARLSNNDGITLLAEDGGHLVGYLIGCLDRTAEYSQPEMIGEIECLFVEPAYRRAGVGGQLIQRFEQWARRAGARRIRVTVSAANRGAIRFYRRCGFRFFDVLFDKLIVTSEDSPPAH